MAPSEEREIKSFIRGRVAHYEERIRKHHRPLGRAALYTQREYWRSLLNRPFSEFTPTEVRDVRNVMHLCAQHAEMEKWNASGSQP